MDSGVHAIAKAERVAIVPVYAAGRAVTLRHQDERLSIYREFERLWIGERAAVVPLAYGDTMVWLRPWITGMWVKGTEISTFAEAIVTRPHPAR